MQRAGFVKSTGTHTLQQLLATHLLEEMFFKIREVEDLFGQRLVADLAGLLPFGAAPWHTSSTTLAVLVNLGLLVLFGLQHSVMARLARVGRVMGLRSCIMKYFLRKRMALGMTSSGASSSVNSSACSRLMRSAGQPVSPGDKTTRPERDYLPPSVSKRRTITVRTIGAHCSIIAHPYAEPISEITVSICFSSKFTKWH